jgi:hypothetical protein
MISHLDKIAKELDMKYSDEMNLDSVENSINAFDNNQVTI